MTPDARSARILVEASTYVPDLHPPVTQVLNTTSYNSSTGAFTVNWSGTDPDQNTGTPAGSISVRRPLRGDRRRYAQRLHRPHRPVQCRHPECRRLFRLGDVRRLADGVQHTYGFYSVGEDDQREWQAARRRLT